MYEEGLTQVESAHTDDRTGGDHETHRVESLQEPSEPLGKAERVFGQETGVLRCSGQRGRSGITRARSGGSTGDRTGRECSRGGVALSAGPASARIVNTPAYITISSFVSGFSLDLNHDGIADFRFGVSASTNRFALFVSARQPGNAILGTLQAVLGIAGTPGVCTAASALPAGHRIGPGSKFGQYRQMTSHFQGFSRSGGSCSGGVVIGRQCGYWGKAQGRFLGFEFTIQGQKHFGWARLDLTHRPTLTGYAYETEPNKPIRAGDTGPIADAREPEMRSVPPAVATLRPPTLGVLALGSAGLDIWRKEE